MDMLSDMIKRTLKSVKNDLGEIKEVLEKFANDNVVEFCPIVAQLDTEGVVTVTADLSVCEFETMVEGLKFDREIEFTIPSQTIPN